MSHTVTAGICTVRVRFSLLITANIRVEQMSRDKFAVRGGRCLNKKTLTRLNDN